MRGSRRSHSIRAAVAAAAIAATTACPPPEPPPPTMPADVGVEWVRDIGGAPNEYDPYVESYGRFRVLDGVRTGPTPVVGNYIPLTPTLGAEFAQFSLPVFPDGTAKFPWNGFAGEHVTTTTTTAEAVTYEVTGPTGSCTFVNGGFDGPSFRTIAAIPSPDETKLAVYRQLIDSDANELITEILIAPLDGTCETISFTRHERTLEGSESTGEQIVSPFAVWSPTSSSIVFTVGRPAPLPDERLYRLDATPGAVAQVVAYPADATIVPLGWSITDRLLAVIQTGGPAAPQRTIVTLPSAGGATTLVDRWTGEFRLAEFSTHYGYFVPGTTKVVYADATRTAVNAQGQTVAWPRFRLFDDATGASGSLEGADSPLMWHTTPFGDAPNVEWLDRFVR